jgi:hypothetical protein
MPSQGGRWRPNGPGCRPVTHRPPWSVLGPHGSLRASLSHGPAGLPMALALARARGRAMGVLKPFVNHPDPRTGRWRLASPSTSGRLRRSPRCWIRGDHAPMYAESVRIALLAFVVALGACTGPSGGPTTAPTLAPRRYPATLQPTPHPSVPPLYPCHAHPSPDPLYGNLVPGCVPLASLLASLAATPCVMPNYPAPAPVCMPPDEP